MVIHIGIHYLLRKKLFFIFKVKNALLLFEINLFQIRKCDNICNYV